jgi:CubicO group peptidase (beta-lactamase class C family)
MQGYVHPDFWPVARVFERMLARARRGGAAACIYHRGEKVVDIWGGLRDAAGNPWQADTPSVSFSTTKGVAATLLHILADRQLINYDAPVASYWPEFAQAGKAHITVRQILCHEAGLYGIRRRIEHAARMLEWEYMTDVLARAVPAHEPGTANGYHAFTFGWLVGELIQRVTGKPITELVRTEIAEPLTLDGLFIGAPVEAHARAAQLIRSTRMLRSPESYRTFARRLQWTLSTLRARVDLARMADALLPRGIEQIDWSSPRVLSVPIPAANGLFTARSLAKLYATLAAGGSFAGTRLLSEETVQRATEIQNRRVDLIVPLRMYWRLGYHRVSTLRGTPMRAFGHFGFGGSGAWADPSRNLATALVLNSGMGTPFGDLRIVRLSGAVLQCADRRDLRST